MRLAIIADVHADVRALTDALAQIGRLGCDAIVCAGDVVDYGMFPQETVELLMRSSIQCIRGNHDRWAVAGQRPHAETQSEETVERKGGRPVKLSHAAIRYLSELPESWHQTIEGVRVAVWHGSPSSDMQGVGPLHFSPAGVRGLLDAAHANVLLVGHTHIAFTVSAGGGGLIANPGALLREASAVHTRNAWLFGRSPANFVPGHPLNGGTFGILELPSKRFSVHRAADGSELYIPRRTVE